MNYIDRLCRAGVEWRWQASAYAKLRDGMIGCRRRDERGMRGSRAPAESDLHGLGEAGRRHELGHLHAVPGRVVLD